MNDKRIKHRVDDLIARGIAAGQAKECTELSKRIGKLLRGREPQVQGAVLADLLATFLAGHHPMLRETMFALHVDVVEDLIPICEEEIFGPNGFPVDDPAPWPDGAPAQDPEPPPQSRSKPARPDGKRPPRHR
jgi:hypothetical protein